MELTEIEKLQENVDDLIDLAKDLRNEAGTYKEIEIYTKIKNSLRTLKYDIYLAPFLDNNATLEILTNNLKSEFAEGKTIMDTISNISVILKSATKAINSIDSTTIENLDGFIGEVDELIETVRG